MDEALKPSDVKKPKHLLQYFALVVGFFCLSISLMSGYKLHNDEQRRIKELVQQEVDTLSYIIQEAFQERMRKLTRLAEHVEVIENHLGKNWEQIIELHLKHDETLRTILWVDKNYKVGWVNSKEKSNIEGLKKYDLKQDPDRFSIIQQAYLTKKIAVTHNIKLIQGGEGFWAASPVFNSKGFQGFVVGVFQNKTFFNYIFKAPIHRNFQIKLYENNDLIYEDVEKEHVVPQWQSTYGMKFQQIEWKLIVAPTTGFLNHIQSLVPEIVMGSGIGLSLLLTLLFYMLGVVKIKINTTKELEEQKRLLLESVGEGIFGLDANGVITFINPAAENILGYSQEELIGKKMHDVIHHSHADGSPYSFLNCPMYKSCVYNSAYKICNEVFWHKDKTSFPVEYFVTPIQKGNEVVGAVVAFSDITIRKEAELTIQKQQKDLQEKKNALMVINNKLKQINEELERFAYVTSHDLKAPLRAIESLVIWIEEDSGERLSEKSKRYFDTLKQRVQRMNNLIQGILNYSRLGRTKLEIDEVNVDQLLKEIIDSLAPSEQFNIQVGASMPVLRAPKIPLMQVFSNLISNGIKYHHQSEGNIIIEAKDKMKFYEFMVSDDGPGIAPEYHEKIFGIFQTLQSRDTIESTGVGLAIVKKIVELQGGRIWVQSEEGEGSRFYFTWPKEPLKPDDMQGEIE